MKHFTLLFASLIFIISSSLLSAACYNKYDYSSGNYYQVCNNGGSTTIRGNNFNTGSNWSQTQNSNGSYYGNDSNGNYYHVNNNTGFYNNLGTGVTCIGKGALRSCF